MTKEQWTKIISIIVSALLAIAAVFGWFLPVEVPEERAIRERIAFDARDDSYLYQGADLYMYSDDHSSQVLHIDGATGNIDTEGTITASAWITDGLLYIDGGIVAASGAITFTDPVLISNTLTVGEDGTSFDVTLYSDTAGDYLLWDQSEEALTIIGTNGQDALNIEDGNVDIEDDLDVNGTTNLDDVDIDLTTSLNIDGHMLDVGSGTYSRADGDNDVGIAGDLEVLGTTELDGALSVAGITTLATGVENFMAPSLITLPITYTAGAGGSGTVATIGDGEIWLILGVYANVTTDWDTTAGDDAYCSIGDGNDPDGLLDLDNAELQAADTEGTGGAAGWQGFLGTDTRGAYFASGTPFLYAPSGDAETIDWVCGADAGDDLEAGEATIYVLYLRIQ